MSKIEVNTVDVQCGSTLTLGSSGKTVQLATGASQSGFGRTGTVNWDTTAKTASFTAVSGNGYFVNTTSGAITVTLPASPSAGDIVSISDYAGTSATNNITIARNGSNFEGGTSNGQIVTNRQAVTLVYVDGTQGWLPISENDSSFEEPLYITATGGTITTCGNFKIHKFTGPGTFTVSCAGNSIGSNTVDYLVVAGGGSGGSQAGGGAGAGGYRESSGSASGCYTRSPLGACVSALPVTATGYPITVGGGGPGVGGPAHPVSPSEQPGSQGSNSIFSTITSTGGGAGVHQLTCMPNGRGGSGGGGTCNSGSYPEIDSNGNTPPVSPAQGFPGGRGALLSPGGNGGGGGGGATVKGTAATGGQAGPGGAGATSEIDGSSVTRAGGGGGGFDARNPGTSAGAGGSGGGTAGVGPGNSSNAAANTGGGSGGGNYGPGGTGGSGNGGSGIVIIRYKYQ